MYMKYQINAQQFKKSHPNRLNSHFTAVSAVRTRSTRLASSELILLLYRTQTLQKTILVTRSQNLELGTT